MGETEGDVAFRAAFAFVDELARRGLERACVSPGSRSTAIALALRRHPNVEVHVHLDERASAFFALGVAKATHRPVAVATTSGTAAAELLPAAVEASMARVPLLLLTADRPPELRGVGANQTIDQRELFGRYAKSFVEAPLPGEESAEEPWRRLAAQALETSLTPPPGPVHVNLPFREPLVPTSVAPPIEPFRGRAATIVAARDDEDGRRAFVAELEAVERGIIVAGSMRHSPRSVVDLARRLRWPLLGEPTSGLRVPGSLAAGSFLLSSEPFLAAHVPELLVQFGAAPTSRAGLELVALSERVSIVDPDELVANPNRRPATTYRTDAETLASAAVQALPARTGNGWLDGWLDADRRARRVVDATVDGWDEPYEGRIARDVAATLSDGSALVVGSSMPIRDLDAYMLPRDGLRVFGNRGASGIDGFVSTALGVGASGATTTALCGDLTLLHDVGSMLWSSRRGYDVVLVVVNNGGGVIFSFLPQRNLPELEELFTTPHGVDLQAVCAAAGVGHRRVDRAAEVVPAVDRARETGGVQVVEVVVDSDLNVRRHAEVHEAVAEVLGSGP